MILIFDECGYVYFIRDGLGHIKIGKTKDVANRIKELQTANPLKLEYFYGMKVKNIYHAGILEKEMHEKFQEHRLCGEWFEEKAVLEFLRKSPIVTRFYTFFEGATW